MAAQRKEIVRNPHPGDPEHFRKQRAKDLLPRRARRTPQTLPAQHRRRQRPAVELAVRRQRKPIQNHKARRHHVVGKACPHMRAQRTRSQIFPFAPRHDIRDQPLLPRHILARNHRGLRHPGMAQQNRLDLARLNAKAAQLHLRIRAPDKLQNPVRAPACPNPPCGTSGCPPPHTGPQQTAPRSAPHARDTHAPGQRRQCKSPPPPPQAQAPDTRPARISACSRSDAQSEAAAMPSSRPRSCSHQTVVSVGPYRLIMRRPFVTQERATISRRRASPARSIRVRQRSFAHRRSNSASRQAAASDDVIALLTAAELRSGSPLRSPGGRRAPHPTRAGRKSPRSRHQSRRGQIAATRDCPSIAKRSICAPRKMRACQHASTPHPFWRPCGA